MQTVRDGLRISVRDNRSSFEPRASPQWGPKSRKLLEGIGENPDLKAGPSSFWRPKGGAAGRGAQYGAGSARSELCDSLSFDFMMVSSERGEPLARRGSLRRRIQLPVNLASLHPARTRVFSADGRLYEVTSVPIREADTQVATLTVGGRFDIAQFGVPRRPAA